MTAFRNLKSLLTVALLAVVIQHSHAGTGLFMKETIQLPTMRTYCIGRYLIDLPEEYAMTSGSELTLYYGLGKDFEKVQVTAPRQRGEQPELDKLVRRASGEFQSQHHFESATKNRLVMVEELDKNSTLVQAYYDSRLLEYYRFHLYAQRNEAIVRLEGFNYPDTRRTPKYVENQLVRVAQNTRFAASPESAGQGTCLGTAVIDAKQDGEVFMLVFKSQKHPDVIVSIDMNSLTESGDGGLLHRVASKAGMLRMLDFSSSTLRRGKREIAGRAGEELLDSGKQEGKVQRHFVAETMVTEPSSPDRPVIAISMSMGGQDKGGAYIDPSLSEKEALAWWDAIISSIRRR